MNDSGSLTGTDADVVRDGRIAFSGLEDLEHGDCRILALLYGHDWPGKFVPAARDLTLPLAILCSRSGRDEDAVMDALSRLSRLTVCLTDGVRSITVPVFRLYQVYESRAGEAMFAYVIPSQLTPHCSEVAARASSRA
jgi:hypothetical protein